MRSNFPNGNGQAYGDGSKQGSAKRHGSGIEGGQISSDNTSQGESIEERICGDDGQKNVKNCRFTSLDFVENGLSV